MLAEQQVLSSWQSDDSPLVLGDIFATHTSVAIWTRAKQQAVSQYFAKAYTSLELGINGVFEINTLRVELTKLLPAYNGRDAAVDDIYLLSDMLTCLFNCDAVGLRMVALNKAMCPSFHIDNIPVRLVSTYLGSGTEWLPLEALSDQASKQNTEPCLKTAFGKYYQASAIQQMQSFDVALLKGKAWQDHEHLGAVHRSCHLAKDEKRVLLTLDPM